MHMGQLIYLGVSFPVAKGAFPSICYKNVLIGEDHGRNDLGGLWASLCNTEKTIDDRQCDLWVNCKHPLSDSWCHPWCLLGWEAVSLRAWETLRNQTTKPCSPPRPRSSPFDPTRDHVKLSPDDSNVLRGSGCPNYQNLWMWAYQKKVFADVVQLQISGWDHPDYPDGPWIQWQVSL